MRAIWSGTLSFGLVALSVRLYTATEEHHVRLREIHTADVSRVRHRRDCEAEDREIPYEEVGRGWEMPDGRLVPLTDEDLERLPLPTKHVVDVMGFVPNQDIDPILYSKPYYVGPGAPPADLPYALLVEALARTGYVGVCKIAVRSRERLAVLRPRHGLLICQTLLCSLVNPRVGNDGVGLTRGTACLADGDDPGVVVVAAEGGAAVGGRLLRAYSRALTVGEVGRCATQSPSAKGCSPTTGCRPPSRAGHAATRPVAQPGAVHSGCR
ncbi:non-homologous end joining protein Ku [Streptomyces lateritius]|uniref:non-homologous end joining protein Ku n=1 Tax=Streptomyces lateritius TaxID=67313 RepID=UPI001678EA5A|nr:Ku protein [Streptomyces lateritius]GGU11209.1 hypothetical protein GCM10010272_65420 [Streptomyces lateritius]